MSRDTRLNIPQNELFYHDETDGLFKPLAVNGAIPVVVVNGGVGGSSMNFIIDAGAPTEDLGNDGDTYLNSVNGDLFKKEEGSWVAKGNLKGLKGDKGNDGAKGATGATGADGRDGFGTEEQYNDIIDRLNLIESKLPDSE